MWMNSEILFRRNPKIHPIYDFSFQAEKSRMEKSGYSAKINVDFKNECRNGSRRFSELFHLWRRDTARYQSGIVFQKTEK